MPRAKHPKGRSTDKLVDDRTAEMVSVLSLRPQVHRSELNRIFTVKWHCSWKTVDRIVSRARKSMLERLGMSRDEFRCQSLAFYEAMACSPSATNSEKLAARKCADDIFGAWAPKQTRIGDPDGKPIAPAVVAPVVNFIIPDNGRTVDEPGGGG